MARQPRIDVPDYPQHLWTRGVNGTTMFKHDVDRHRFMGHLRYAFTKHGCDLHAFVLMTNHVHLLATGRTPYALSRAMQSVGRRYVKYFNEHYQRTGTLFEGRFKSSLVESDRYFLTLMRYIELNPVRARMVPTPQEHAWSSFANNASGDPIAPLVAHPCYLALGLDADARARSYRLLLQTPVSAEELDVIRDANRTSRVLGDKDFAQQLSDLLNRAIGPAWRGGARSSTARPARSA